MAASLAPLPADRLDEVVEVLTDAFRVYPVMRFIVGPAGDVDARVERLVRFFVTRRLARGGPMLGVVAAERLAGAAVLTLPNEPDPSPEVIQIAAAAWRELGEDARGRYAQYVKATEPFTSGLPVHHHLNMIGVRGDEAGKGYARPLLDAVRQMALDDPTSHGVSLTTEVARNVTLYEHFGYEVVGHARVSPELESWGLFLPTS